MNKTKGFSYDTEKHMDIINHIEKQPHQANYIIELVRADMYKSGNDIEELVKKYVKKYCKEVDSKEEDGTEIGIDSVMDLLNLGK